MSVDTADFTYISTLVGERSAIVLAPEKSYLVESRLTPLARDLGLPGIGGLVEQLRRTRDRTLENKVVEAMTTNETSWFRDVHPFEALKHVILPDVLARNAVTRSLRIWSAAASTGQELYSVSMLLDNDFPQLATWSVDLLGTDLSSEVIAKAREARYSGLEVNRGLPAHLLVKYMEREGRDFRVAPTLRERCRFEELNLIGRWPPRPLFDVVLLRNVLIYFDVDVKRRILEQVRGVLRPGGYLLLGAAETTLGVVDGYSPVSSAGSVVYRSKEQ